MMRCFLRDEHIYGIKASLPDADEFQGFRNFLSAQSNITLPNSSLLPDSIHAPVPDCISTWKDLQMVQLPKCGKSIWLDDTELRCLHLMYATLYPDENICPHHIAPTCVRYTDLQVGVSIMDPKFIASLTSWEQSLLLGAMMQGSLNYQCQPLQSFIQVALNILWLTM